MTVVREPALMELDMLASDPETPYGIITADCTNPREIDDGIAVEELAADKRLYRVHVFAADTSALYTDHKITRQAVEKTEARYLQPLSEEESYEPMLDEEAIRDLQFSAGKTRSALAISFTVGNQQPFTDVRVGYGNVEVKKNYRYDRFSKSSRDGEELERFSHAAGLIVKWLRSLPGSSEESESVPLHTANSGAFKRGATINQAFMVAANYMVARMMDDSDLAIYRVHNPADQTFADFMNPNVARFSTQPSTHVGLGLDRYTRVTSPLRRAEDFIMHGLLRARHEGRLINGRDHRLVTATVQRLNQRIVSDIFKGRVDPKLEAHWVAQDGLDLAG